MQFKTPQQQLEFRQLQVNNRNLAAIIASLNFQTLTNLHRQICVTEVFRNEGDNRKLYARPSSPHIKKRTTAHTVWSAVDVRSHDFNSHEQQRIIAFLKQFDKYNTWGYMVDSKTVLLHAEGTHGLHFHIQFTGHLPSLLFRWDENDDRHMPQFTRTA